jgi:hypothetical protein
MSLPHFVGATQFKTRIVKPTICCLWNIFVCRGPVANIITRLTLNESVKDRSVGPSGDRYNDFTRDRFQANEIGSSEDSGRETISRILLHGVMKRYLSARKYKAPGRLRPVHLCHKVEFGDCLQIRTQGIEFCMFFLEHVIIPFSDAE